MLINRSGLLWIIESRRLLVYAGIVLSSEQIL